MYLTPNLFQFPTRETIISTLLKEVPESKKETLCDFLIRLYAVYVDLHCNLIRSFIPDLALIQFLPQSPTSKSTP